MTWLEEYDPQFDWRGKSLSFSDKQGRRHVLQKYSTGLAVWKPPVPAPPSARPAPLRHGLNLITARQLRRQNRDGLIDWAFMVAPELVSEVLDQIVSSAASQPAQHRCSAVGRSPAVRRQPGPVCMTFALPAVESSSDLLRTASQPSPERGPVTSVGQPPSRLSSARQPADPHRCTPTETLVRSPHRVCGVYPTPPDQARRKIEHLT